MSSSGMEGIGTIFIFLFILFIITTILITLINHKLCKKDYGLPAKLTINTISAIFVPIGLYAGYMSASILSRKYWR